MGLSRLDNFLKSARGAIIYVDPNSLDSTDSIENQGNSLTRPFKTLQRALIEAARFSYQRGTNNDRFAKTTIVLYPGEHVVDNRPGYIPTGPNQYLLRSGATTDNLPPWNLSTNFDLRSPNNTLWKLNSIHGGVIIPRGTSIVGMDLRKTIIRPTYVPNPENDNIERSAVFRVTGSSYLWQFTILDADPNSICYKDYTTNTFVPNFSHHKLTAFEYADGVNNVEIDDDFISDFKTTRTDLDMYYEKVGIVYGQSSGRPIFPDYVLSTIDIETVVDEYRIVGSRGAEVGITSIRSGDGSTTSTTITVTLDSELEGLGIDTPIRIEGVGVNGYDGQYVISGVNSSTEITYSVQNAPTNPLPSASQIANATLNITVDSVTSASPYIFNISLRSVYGMCGLLADGDKATGFKSMVVAQFTGIGLQKDTNAYVKYDETSGTYKDNTVYQNLNTDSRARYKPSYSNFHIKSTNNSFLQLVSIFAIGYAEHFVSENGGDLSITNSNSNFGAKSLVASGFRKDAFVRDDVGYFTNFIPPKELRTRDTSVEFVSIDVGVTTSKSVGAATTDKLYLYNQTNQDVPPSGVIDGYRLGAKVNDTLFVELSLSGVTTERLARITMPGTNVSSQKEYSVGRSAGINSITANVLTLTSSHELSSGETIRVISESGNLPDGLNQNQIYFAITDEVDITLQPDEIKLAQTFSEAINDSPLTVNNKGGILSIQSRVSDKAPSNLGHPIQWDGSQWYVSVSTTSTENTIYSSILSGGTSSFGDATPRTYLKRRNDDRSLLDTIYRVRYVIPKENLNARPPIDGYVIQESNSVIGTGNTEIQKYFDPNNASTLDNSSQLRNPRFIATCSWSSNTASVITEIPHDLKIGSEVKIVNVTSTNNPTGVAVSGFNGTYTVAGISSTKEFSYSLTTDPGTFTNDISSRTTSLPYFQRKRVPGTYQIYRSSEIQKYVPGLQDGIYHLIVTNSSNQPTVVPFENQRFSQPIQNLYPQTNRDNPNSDPKETSTFAVADPIGLTVVNDPQKSITKETSLNLISDFNVGFGLTDIVSNSAGTAHTFFTQYDHGFSGITSVSIVSGGSGYGSGSAGSIYNARLVGFAGSTTGEHATAVITFNASGVVTGVKIMDGGSAYGIGNTLAIQAGSPTSEAVVQVTHVLNPINEGLQLEGITPNSNDGYNRLYKITGVQVGNSKQIEVESSGAVSNPSTTGLGLENTSSSKVITSGVTLGISTIVYSPVTGLATIGFTQSHGFTVDNKLNISGATDSFFNGDAIVTRVNSHTSLVADVGVGTGNTSTGGTINIFRYGLASQSGDISSDYVQENLGGRFNFEYVGVTTTLGTQINTNSSDVTPLDIPNAATLGLKIGDYLLIDTEIFRIKSDVTSDSVSVFRAVLGTERETHDSGSVVTKVRVNPIELHRNSIIRASGHTFEYVGFGPGNYSTALPERQDRIISAAEELIAQNTKIDGGISIFTAMNSDGDFYTGNKKVNSATGEEEVFDAPVPTVTGEELETRDVSVGFDLLTPLEASITRSLRVEGGPDKNLISEFDGPVIFNNKITSNSDKGIESTSLFLQGNENVSRRFSVSNSEPSLAGNYGDINFNSVPSRNGFVGWAYVKENSWEPFGFIGDQGVGISSGGTYVGFSTLLNLVATGFTFSVDFDATSGISTLTFDAQPRVAITTGALAQNLVGVVTTINFVGALVTVTGGPTGIATVNISPISLGGSLPGLPFNSLQYNDNGAFNGVVNSYYDETNNRLHFGNYSVSDPSTSLTITSDGRVGMSSYSPTAKLEIVADNERSIYIKSTSGSEIVRIENTATDTRPFIIDQNGYVGINTGTTIAPLDVVGNVAITGVVRIYETDRTNYVGLQVSSLSSDLIFTLPTSYGTDGYALKTNGSGVLSWGYASSEVTDAGSGINITKTTSGGITTATISNSGVRKIIAGIGISLSPTSGTGDVTITSSGSGSGSIYPFTTRGFSIPI
jgi:hypothetical protein